MKKDERKSLLERLRANLDGSGSDSEHAAIKALKPLGLEAAELLLEVYSKASRWGVRVACVWYGLPLSRESDFAVQMGILGLNDRSKVVRYRASQLLAYSQSHKGLLALRSRIAEVEEADEFYEDLSAAILAIQEKNHHLFFDRDNSGKHKWFVDGLLSRGCEEKSASL